jgi:hypothetical protein
LHFGSNALQLRILRGVLVHPLDGLVVPAAGLLLGAKLPVVHGQEETVGSVAAFAFLGSSGNPVDNREKLKAVAMEPNRDLEVIPVAEARAAAPQSL